VLQKDHLIPEMMVVSVEVDGMKDLTPTYSPDYGPTSGGAPQFVQFLKEELIPFVDGNFRTRPCRMIWSHSIGGVLCVYALLEAPDVFQVCLTSSPFFLYDREKRFFINKTASFLKGRTNEKNYLYVTVGNEPGLKPQIDEFISILKKNRPAGLIWEYTQMASETHRTIMDVSLAAGLKAFYTAGERISPACGRIKDKTI
jgi:predicted alpha/beta superfamily hydrolase